MPVRGGEQEHCLLRRVPRRLRLLLRDGGAPGRRASRAARGQIIVGPGRDSSYGKRRQPPGWAAHPPQHGGPHRARADEEDRKLAPSAMRISRSTNAPSSANSTSSDRTHPDSLLTSITPYPSACREHAHPCCVGGDDLADGATSSAPDGVVDAEQVARHDGPESIPAGMSVWVLVARDDHRRSESRRRVGDVFICSRVVSSRDDERIIERAATHVREADNFVN